VDSEKTRRTPLGSVIGVLSANLDRTRCPSYCWSSSVPFFGWEVIGYLYPESEPDVELKLPIRDDCSKSEYMRRTPPILVQFLPCPDVCVLDTRISWNLLLSCQAQENLGGQEQLPADGTSMTSVLVKYPADVLFLASECA
jgi:hypothetical protein